ncbi:MAG: DUF2004 domain-containing protein [Polyangiaceae bacterium]|nr:DUF2004 domain-containing protein [Polyangiaceae bacterium]
MPTNEVELSRRKKLALDAIKRSLGTEAGEFGATLFATHHLDELDPSYWQTHLKIDKPKPAHVLELLCLQSHWSDSDEEGIDTLDFGLPGNVSNYVLSVRFDENGEVDEISMES